MTAQNRGLGLPPLITVVLTTRNRGDRIDGAIKSILASKCSSFALHIVDQSDNDSTEKVVRHIGNDFDISYFRSKSIGISSARNIGIAHAKTEFIALTDDDCEVSTTWLPEINKALKFNDKIGIVFGNVFAGKHNSFCGFITAYERSGACLISKMREHHKVGGIGACMGLRRSVWVQLAGFDEMLGTGSRFCSAEELDFGIRTLQAGYSIFETDRVFIVHNGFRTWAEAHQLAYDYLYGIGAVFGKHLKCRRWNVLAPLYKLGLRWAFGKPLLNYGRRPPRMLRLNAFLSGLQDSLKSPVDPNTCRFAV
jgi:glycosyltransferase involved in cell wall biosynthesis